MFKVIRTIDIGIYDNPQPWGATMKKCNTRTEAMDWINEQPSWMLKELSIEEE